MSNLDSSKFQNRLRQYGLRAAIGQILRGLIRNVYRIEQNIVFVIPDFSGYEFHDPCISPLTRERIRQAVNAKELQSTDLELTAGFLDEGCLGVCAEIEGELAGYAWIQTSGEYRFGQSGRMIIPPKHVIVKNLLVLQEHRGKRIGQKLNATLLSLIQPGHTPVVFIVPENRYAIRNSEKYGFQRVLEVSRSQWLGGPWRTQITTLSPCTQADALIKALKSPDET